ncbi:MAG: LD-carboxypeptidase [Acidobacteriota bacterium]
MRQRKSIVVPPALLTGARIAVVAPGSAVPTERLESGLAVLRSWGFEPVLGRYVQRPQGDLAATDERRAADLSWALTDPAIDAVWAARGGWGAARLLASLDLAGVRRNPRWVIGFSDLTVIQAAMLQHGLPSLYAPVVIELTNAERVPDDSLAVWLRHPETVQSFRLKSVGARPKRPFVRGPLAGGCLTLLASLAGTRWQPNLDGAVVFLEEVGEAPYRIDRLLWQLRASRMLDNIAALVFGQFTRCDPPPGRESRSLDTIFRDHATALGRPAYSGLPVGHGAGAIGVPLGYNATLDTVKRTLRLDPPFA